jgi:hypothetical protein
VRATSKRGRWTLHSRPPLSRPCIRSLEPAWSCREPTRKGGASHWTLGSPLSSRTTSLRRTGASLSSSEIAPRPIARSSTCIGCSVPRLRACRTRPMVSRFGQFQPRFSGRRCQFHDRPTADPPSRDGGSDGLTHLSCRQPRRRTRDRTSCGATRRTSDSRRTGNSASRKSSARSSAVSETSAR